MLCQSTSRFFFIFCLCLALMGAVGCRKQKAPDYNRGTSQAVADVCAALLAGDDNAAVLAIQKLQQDPESAGFAEITMHPVLRLQQLRALNNILLDGDYELLREWLKETEDCGEASVDLVAYSGHPDAMEALANYLKGMPYTTAEAMRDELDKLQAHLHILNTSTFFREFYLSQHQRLTELRQKAVQSTEARLLTALDKALFSGDLVEEGKLANALAAIHPKHSYLQLQQTLPNTSSLPGPKGRELQPLLLAACRVWDALPAELKGQLAAMRRSQSPISLCDAWLPFRESGNQEDYLRLLAYCRKRPDNLLPPSQATKDYLRHYIMNSINYHAWCWQSPCAGVTEVLARLHQAGSTTPK